MERSQDGLTIDPIKAFAYLVYAGLCNNADAKDLARPTFEDCYELTEEILLAGDQLQNDIWTAFKDSRAGSNMIEKVSNLNTAQKKSKKQTGMK